MKNWIITALFPHQHIETGELLPSTWVPALTNGSSKVVKFSDPIESDVKEGANIIL